MIGMKRFKAVVRNRRLVIDEVVNEPDGTEHELIEAGNWEDELDEDELRELDAALARSREDVLAGRVRPAAELIKEMRSTRR
jgi:hypothetical protein